MNDIDSDKGNQWKEDCRWNMCLCGITVRATRGKNHQVQVHE